MKLIMAMSLNGVIGIDGKLPWDVPGDRKLFRNLTRDGILVMGSRTFQSLPSDFNKAEREVWVISRYQRHIPGADRVMSIESLEQAWHREDVKDRMWICGGGAVYETVLKKFVSRIREYHITVVHQVIGSFAQRHRTDAQGNLLVQYSPLVWSHGRLKGPHDSGVVGDEPDHVIPQQEYTYLRFVVKRR